MKITITTPTNNPYDIHPNTIADLLKCALARFALRREGNRVSVESERVVIVVEAEESTEEWLARVNQKMVDSIG